MNFAEVLKTQISPLSGTVYIRVEDLGPLPAEGPDTLYLDFLQIQTFDANTSPYLGGGHTAHGGPTDLCLYQSAQVGYLGGIVEPSNVEGVLQIDLCATDFLGGPAWPTYLYYNPKASSVSVQLNVGPEPVDIYDTITQQFLQQGVTGVRSFNVPSNSARVLVLTKSGALRYYHGGKLFVDGAAVDYYSPAARASEDTPANTAPLDAALNAALAASPKGDGMSNLLKYALGLNPQVMASKVEREVVKLARNSSGQNGSSSGSPSARRCALPSVQVSEDLETWTALARPRGAVHSPPRRVLTIRFPSATRWPDRPRRVR